MKMSSKKFNKTCTICGEKAFGFNFGAISCESCKAFFRRNASKLELYSCPFEDNCRIDQVTRKNCRKCRLKKCFALGMRQEWILNDKEREERRIKIERNKKGKHKRNHCESSVSSQTESICSDSNDQQMIVSNYINDEDIVNNIMEIESYLSEETTRDSTQLSSDQCKQNDKIYYSTYKKAVELELADLPIPRPVNDYLSLSEVECNRLTELLNATMFFKTSYPSKTMETTTSFDDLIKFFFVKFECFTQKFVDVVKGINSFSSICEDDQIVLVKYSSFEVLLMRTALYYNYEKEQWTFTMDSNNSIIFKLDVLRNGKRNLYPMYKNYLNNIFKEWDNDSVIIDLLMAILLFNPDRPKLIHKEAIKFQQHLYMFLLQRYLQLKYKSECESKVKFLRILNVLEDIHKLHEIHRSNYKEVNSQYFGPLLREILDLNPENSLSVL